MPETVTDICSNVFFSAHNFVQFGANFESCYSRIQKFHEIGSREEKHRSKCQSVTVSDMFAVLVSRSQFLTCLLYW